MLTPLAVTRVCFLFLAHANSLRLLSVFGCTDFRHEQLRCAVSYPSNFAVAVLRLPSPAEAYRRLTSLIVFLPSPVTLHRWGLKYPRWKQHLACSFILILFYSVSVCGFTACSDRVEREYITPFGTAFSHSIVADRFVLLCFRVRPVVGRPQADLTSAI